MDIKMGLDVTISSNAMSYYYSSKVEGENVKTWENSTYKINKINPSSSSLLLQQVNPNALLKKRIKGDDSVIQSLDVCEFL